MLEIGIKFNLKVELEVDVNTASASAEDEAELINDAVMEVEGYNLKPIDKFIERRFGEKRSMRFSRIDWYESGWHRHYKIRAVRCKH